MILRRPAFDEHQMAMDWVANVNGTDIHPKLPVYLRTYHEEWKRKRRIKDAVHHACAKTVH